MSLFRELYGTPSRISVGNAGSCNNPTPTPDQRSLFPDSLTTTPICGTRRRRNDEDCYNFEDDVVITKPAGTVPITPRTSKRLKISSEEIALLYDVDPQRLADFAEVRQYHLNLFRVSYSICSPKHCCT